MFAYYACMRLARELFIRIWLRSPVFVTANSAPSAELNTILNLGGIFITPRQRSFVALLFMQRSLACTVASLAFECRQVRYHGSIKFHGRAATSNFIPRVGRGMWSIADEAPPSTWMEIARFNLSGCTSSVKKCVTPSIGRIPKLGKWIFCRYSEACVTFSP